jgi:chaperonin cofactor prefoldin
MSSLKLPTSWEALAKLHRLIELEDKIKRLGSEIEEIGKVVRDTPIAREIGFFIIRVRRLQDWCFTARFSLLEDYNVSESSIAELERELEVLRKDWIKFIRNNNLGILWL